MNERLNIAIPTGVFQNNVLRSLKEDIGLTFNHRPREYRIKADNIPITLILARAGSIPQLLNHPQSKIQAGITGSDILWEAGQGPEAGIEYPLYVLQPQLNQPKLYIGASKSWVDAIQTDKNRPVLLSDLSGSRVATKYPCIAREIFRVKQVPNVVYEYVPGGDEGLQFIFPDCHGILSIMDTGETMRANKIELLEIIHLVLLRLVHNPDKLSRHDTDIFADLQEKIYQAIAKSK